MSSTKLPKLVSKNRNNEIDNSLNMDSNLKSRKSLLDKDMIEELNPFSLIKNKSVYDLKHLQNKRDVRLSHFRSQSIKSNFDSLDRIFLASQRAYSILKECGRETNEIERLNCEVSDEPNTITNKLKFKHVPLPSFVETKRQRSVANLERLTKQHEYTLLDDVIKMEEENLQTEITRIDFHNDWHHINLHKDCALTTAAMGKAEKALRERHKMAESVRKSLYMISTLSSETLKMEESWKKLVSYKEFLNSCKSRIDSYRIKDKSQFEDLPNDDIGEIEERFSDLKSAKQDLEIDFKENISSNLETETLEALENYLENNKSVSEIFSHPDDFVKMIEEIEYHNLSVFENVQREEKSFERAKTILTNERAHQEKKISHLKKLHDVERERLNFYYIQIEALEGRLCELNEFLLIDRFKDLFKLSSVKKYKTVLDVLEDIFKLTNKTINNTMKPNNYCVNDLKIMLNRIELYVDNLHMKISNLDNDTLTKCKKSQEEYKRHVARLMTKERERLALEKRIEKVLNKANQPSRKRTGRPIIYRSQPPRPPKEIITVDSDLERLEEEKRIFFT